MRMHNVNIGTRLAGGFGTLVLLLILAMSIVVGFGWRTSLSIAEVNRSSDVVVGFKDLLLDIRQTRALTWAYLAVEDPQALQGRLDALQKFETDCERVRGLLITETGKRMLAQIHTNAMTFAEIQKGIIGLKAQGVAATAPDYAKAVADMKRLGKINADAAEEAARFDEGLRDAAVATANAQLDDAVIGSIVIGCVGVLIAIVSGWLITRSIAKPVRLMTEAMVAIASGDYSRDVPCISHGDEIGELALAAQIFRDNGRWLNESQAEAVQQQEVMERGRASQEAIRATLQDRQQMVMASLATGLGRLSGGDLTARLDAPFAEDYEKLRFDFNATASALQEALSTIATATRSISAGSDQIADASDDLSRRTEQQAASVEETAAALGVITETVKAMAADAGEAARVVVRTRAAAENSGAIVRQAVEAMGKIKDSSVQIGNIIGVINEIAFQTNLLALNAGVEAARAGEAGRGFAVVASEVRALAQRSAEAAKEIKTLISESTTQVESGVDLVGRTGGALNDIIDKVAEMDGLVRQISTASHEQAAGLTEVNTVVGRIDEIVQQNAAMVEESTAAAHALKRETQDLTAMVERFDIGGRAAPQRPIQAPRRVSPVKRAAPRAA